MPLNFDGKEISYKNEIIKIEESYCEASNVKDFYARWHKLSKLEMLMFLLL